MSELLEKRNQQASGQATELVGSSASRSAWLWGSVVVAFLILQLVIGGLAFNLATGDPSVAVMPDYHQRALNWDDEMARRQRSDQLGWRATLTWGTVTVSETGESGREVMVQVADTGGSAVTDGDASILFFHHTRAGDVSTLKLQERASGEYVATLPMQKPGFWDIEFSLARGPGEAFWHQETLDISDDAVTAVNFATDTTE
jgi:nitrogen fixation protein FixH